MANTLVQFRIDEKQRKQAEDICEQLGFDLSSYLRMSVTRLVREKRVPFELSLDSGEDSAYLKALDRMHRRAEENGTADMSLEEINVEIAAVRAEEVAKGLAAMKRLSRSAELNGVADMSLEEINAEIAAARTEKN